MPTLKESKGFEPGIFPTPVCGEVFWIDGGSLDSQDFEGGCFQTRSLQHVRS